MLIFVAILLALVPAVAILYPFVRRREDGALSEDESSPQAELARRWDAALAGLRNVELERTLGNLAEEDYHWIRQQYMTEAAGILKAMELEEQREQELLADIEHQLRETRRLLGEDGANLPITCLQCTSQAPSGSESCPACGHPLAVVTEKRAGSGLTPSQEPLGE